MLASKKRKKARAHKSSGIVAIQEATPDPRQALFLAAYLDPESETFSNALQSGLAAGYSQEYSESILSKGLDWLAESVGDLHRVRQAERHMDEVMRIPILVQAMGAFGPLTKKIPTGRFKWVTKKGKRKKVEICDEEPIMVYSPSLIKEKSKVAEIVLPALSKAKYGKPDKGSGPPIVPIQINIERDRELFA